MKFSNYTYPIYGGATANWELIQNFSSWVFAAARINASVFSCVPLRLYQYLSEGQRKEILSHPVLDILNAPNDIQDKSELLAKLSLYFDIVGNAYIQILRTFDIPSGLFLMPSQYVRPRFENSEHIGWDVGKSYGQFLPKDDVIHIKDWNIGSQQDPSGLILGKSRLEAAWSAVLANIYSSEYDLAFLKRMGTPQFFLVSEQDQWGQDVKDEFFAEYQRWIANKDNLGSPLVLWKGMKPEFLGDSKSVKGQIASGNKTTTDIIIQEIAAIFQIPTAMLTNLQQVSGGVIERVDAQHLQQCIIPRWNAVEERLNRTLMLLWSKDGFRLVADDEPSNPHVDQANAKEWLTANIIDRNEARELVGFHKTSEQDELPAQLSGAQLDSMSQIALNASQGFIPRESAIGQLMVGLGFTRQEAEQILGPIGQSNYQPVDMNGGK